MFKAVAKGDRLVSVAEGKFCCGEEFCSGDNFFFMIALARYTILFSHIQYLACAHALTGTAFYVKSCS